MFIMLDVTTGTQVCTCTQVCTGTQVCTCTQVCTGTQVCTCTQVCNMYLTASYREVILSITPFHRSLK